MTVSMSRRTRYVVLASGGVLAAGLCGGLVAWLNPGTPRGVAADAPAELAFVPSNATAVAYADMRAVMASEFRRRLRQIAPDGVGREQLERHLGLNVERDIDRVLMFWVPEPDGGSEGGGSEGGGSGLSLFAGRFDAARLEAAARSRGAAVSDENGIRLVSLDVDGVGPLAMAFLQPGLTAVGEPAAVRRVARRGAGEAGLVADEGMTRLLGRVDTRSSAWAVGRLTDPGLFDWVPDTVSRQLPAVTAFAVQARIDSGLGVALTVEGRDEQAAQNLRDVVRGFVALTRLQAFGAPELQAILDSLETGGTGTSVTLSFRVSAEALDLLMSMVSSADAS